MAEQDNVQVVQRLFSAVGEARRAGSPSLHYAVASIGELLSDERCGSRSDGPFDLDEKVKAFQGALAV